MGDFAGAVLKYLRRHPVPRLTMAGGIGKLAKLADGHLDLHSGRSQVVLRLARGAGAGAGGSPRAGRRRAGCEHRTGRAAAVHRRPASRWATSWPRAPGRPRSGCCAARRSRSTSWSSTAPAPSSAAPRSGIAWSSRGGCRGTASALSTRPTMTTAVRRTPAVGAPAARCRPACRAAPARRPGWPWRPPRPGSRRRSARASSATTSSIRCTARCSTSVAPVAAQVGQLLPRRHRRGARRRPGEDDGLRRPRARSAPA